MYYPYLDKLKVKDSNHFDGLIIKYLYYFGSTLF